MGQLRSDFVQAMKKDMYDYFFEKYDALPPKFPEIFAEETSEGAYEKQTTALMPGELDEKQVGEPIKQKKLAEGYIVYEKNRTFAQEIALEKETVEDDRKVENRLRKAASGWGESVNLTQERFFARFFNYGGYLLGHDVFNASIPGEFVDPSGDLCYDKFPFFNLSDNLRKSKGGGTYYNGLAKTLTPANFMEAWLLITSTNNRNENDDEVAIIPDTLLVPTALQFTADEILKSTLVPYMSTHTKNVLADIVERVTWPFLNNTGAWFLGCRKKGLTAFKRQDPEIDFFRDPHTRGYFANIDVRWGGWMENWRYWVGSNFLTEAA